MIETIHWHTLHPRYIGPQSLILDLGANYGLFAKAITDRFNCRCVAIEPSPVPFASIPENSLISKIQVAVGAASEVRSLHIASEATASSLVRKANSYVDTIDVRVLSLQDLTKQLGWDHIDLLKVDIEGEEIAMLAACSDRFLGQIAQISIEFHDFCGITPADEVRATLTRLHRIGFESVRMSRVGHQDTWLINRRLTDISMAEILYTRHVLRNWYGLNRLASRLIYGAPNN